MNGAESLLTTLRNNGIGVCFANPGTSEMQFVAALDRVSGLRCILGLFEGVVTGAADGYARMSDQPAATLLHLGPGLANGLSNLHNALRASVPMVNIIGDHATFHRSLDAPLTSDIEGTARPFSHWIRTTPCANAVAADAVAAVAAARSAPGRIASLIVPADASWEEVTEPLSANVRAEPLEVKADRADDELIRSVAEVLRSGKRTALIMGGRALRADCLELAGKVAAQTGARLLATTYTPRIARGAGRVAVERIPFAIDEALSLLADYETLILVGAKPPVAFFAYPNRPSRLYARGAQVIELASMSGDPSYALEALADYLGASAVAPIRVPLQLPARPTGSITAEKIGALLAACLPEGAIVIDESLTTGRSFLRATQTARPHDWIPATGGSIGFALPAATGAAIACPERRVIALESDGSGMYMPQTLWTHVRESLNIVTIIFANRKYQILRNEMSKMGVQTIGPAAAQLLEIDRPTIDWVGLGRSLGVVSFRAESMEEFARHLEGALTADGPHLIEVVL